MTPDGAFPILISVLSLLLSLPHSLPTSTKSICTNNVITRAYGNYTTYFAPPPQPSCSPAPPHHRLPCPHSARHLIITPSTFRHHFGRAFRSTFPDHSIFALARTGYEVLFHLSSLADSA